MKALILAAMGAALIAGTAFAQNNPAPPPPPPAPPAVGAPPNVPGPGPMGGDAMAPPFGFHGRHGWHGGPPPMMLPSKAAHFVVGRGSAFVDVKCAEDEPMKACADILLNVLNQIGFTLEPALPSPACAETLIGAFWVGRELPQRFTRVGA